MVGHLKLDSDGRFCVEYADRNVQVFWRAGAPEALARAQKWIKDALPRQEKVPESMLSSLIGARVAFTTQPRFEEKTVEWSGTLSDGGSIKLVYFKRVPLSDAQRRDAVEVLSGWANSYLNVRLA